ncbi:Omp28-related outer membrane protein [Marinifilum sp.]|uniref:Omp28-related outer membrane protein n=1 Tax=Marinifilum sp. TaxID=2033137 RepID=UPI003BABA9AD
MKAKITYQILLSVIVLILSACSSDEKLVVEDSPNETSGEENTEASDSGITVVKRVLIEDYVATWCGNCILAIEKSENADKSVFVPVAIHFLGSELENETAINVASENKVSSQTTVIVDKHTSHSFRNDFSASDYTRSSKVAIAINPEVNGTNLNVNLKFKFYKNLSTLNYTVYLLENNIVATQTNYQFSGSEYQSSPRSISNFNHNHVLQQAVLQQNIPGSESASENVYETSQTFSIAGKNSDNLEVVVFVESSDEVLNTQIVSANEQVDFHAEEE